MENKSTEYSLFIKFLGMFMALAAFIVMAEVILRATDVNVHFENRFFPVNRDVNYSSVFKRDSRLFWRFRENIQTESKHYSHVTYHINSLGLRGPEPDMPKRGYRILALGNSCTFGWGIEYQYTWVRRLQEILSLRASGRRFEVINAGIPGYSSFQGIVALETELLDLTPDMVLIMFGWNDHWPAGEGITDAEQKAPGDLLLRVHNGLSRLKLFQLIRRMVLSVVEGNRPASLGEMVDDLTSRRRVPRDRFRQNLVRLVRLSREHGAEPVLLVPPVASPERYFDGGYFNLHVMHGWYQDDIREVAARENVPLVDLQSTFDNHGDLFDRALQDPIHFNRKGQEVAAETCANVILPIANASPARR